jgi:hypothetical protein
VKLAVNDEAAKTVIDPVSGASVAVAEVEAAGDGEGVASSSSPQAAITASPATAASPKSSRRSFFNGPSF